MWGRTNKKFTHLARIRNLEEEIQKTVWQANAERILQVDLVALEHILGMLGAPPEQLPNQMVLDHCDHGMGNVALLLGQRRIEILLELLLQLLHDDTRVGDFRAV